jgi:hypothetical protein
MPTKSTTHLHLCRQPVPNLHQAVQPSQIKSPPQQSLQTTKPKYPKTYSPAGVTSHVTIDSSSLRRHRSKPNRAREPPLYPSHRHAQELAPPLS